MITRRSVLAAGGAVAALAARPGWAQTQPPSDGPAMALLDAIAQERLEEAPGTASSRGLDVGENAALRSKLADYSGEGRMAMAARVDARLRQLAALPADMSPAAHQHVAVVKAAYASGQSGLAFPYGRVAVGGWQNAPYVVIQNVGSFIEVPRLLDADHKLETAADGDAYLARLKSFANALDDESARLRAATAAGVIPPTFLLDKATRSLRSLRDGDPAGKRIVSRLAGFDAAKGAAAQRVFADEVASALDRQIAALAEQRAAATDVAGVWRLPDGEAYYRWALAASTTTTRTPDEIHAQGLDELARLQSQMDGLLKGLGYSQGSVGARMAALGKDRRYTFAEGDAGRDEILAFVRGRIEMVRPKLPLAFARKGGGRVEVRRIPVAEELGAAGAYGGPGSADGTIPGKFWINLRSPAQWTRYNLPTLAHHEAIPGHVWQGEYSFGLPAVRSMLSFNAYSEGWGLYAEQLADELGLYEGDPAGRLGYLQSMAFRACRLVVDTGLHGKRWTRPQAIRWMAEANGQHAEEVETEVDRYCSWPGQACGYKVGHSEINRLRDRAKAALGPRYDGRAFNDAVLEAGWMPLGLLAQVVDGHIAARKA